MQDYGYIDPRSHLIPRISEVIHHSLWTNTCSLFPSFFFFFHISVWHITYFHNKYSYISTINILYIFLVETDLWISISSGFWTFKNIEKCSSYCKVKVISTSTMSMVLPGYVIHVVLTQLRFRTYPDTFRTPNRWDTSVLSLPVLSALYLPGWAYRDKELFAFL